jgi:hypothetical protein
MQQQIASLSAAQQGAAGALSVVLQYTMLNNCMSSCLQSNVGYI